MKNADWGAGPWDEEPDRVEWRDEATGLPCLALRHERLGHWCGYVAVPPGHPAHGRGYDDVPAEVHGGLTYAEKCHGQVCHKPAPGEPEDAWWLGFDCAHGWDLSPGLYRSALYRDLPYVQAECAALARQLKEIA